MQEPKETWVWSLGQENPLKEEMATHSSILAWRIPRTEKPGGLQSMGSQTVWNGLGIEHWCTRWKNPGLSNQSCLVSLESSCCLVTQSCPTLATPGTAACQAPLSMGFSRPEYWSGLPFPTAGDLPDPGLNLHLLHSQADSLPLCFLRSPCYKYT